MKRNCKTSGMSVRAGMGYQPKRSLIAAEKLIQAIWRILLQDPEFRKACREGILGEVF